MKKLSVIMLVILMTGCNNQQIEEKDKTITRLEQQLEVLQGNLDLVDDKEARYMDDIAELESTVERLETEAMTNANFQNTLEEMRNKIEILEAQLSEQETEDLLSTARDVVAALKIKDYKILAAYVDNTLGISFSPYGHMDLETDVHFTKGQLALIADDETVYDWGVFDGSGFPIEQSFEEYYTQFIFDHDYTEPQVIGIDTVIGSGNTPFNISSVYPEGHFVEFHFKGFDPEYAGMDWSSLRLVFRYIDDQWRLVHISHGQWTI